MEIAADDRSEAFRKSANWCVRQPPVLPENGGVSFTQATDMGLKWLSPTTRDVFARSDFKFPATGFGSGGNTGTPKVRLAVWTMSPPLAP